MSVQYSILDWSVTIIRLATFTLSRMEKYRLDSAKGIHNLINILLQQFSFQNKTHPKF